MRIKERFNIKEQKKGIFYVNLLGIIFDTKTRKILIGKRVKDDLVPKLTWSFPGGVPSYNEDLEKSLERKILKKTGLKVKSLGNIFSRIPKENRKFLLLYYLCEVVSGKEKPGSDFTELKWVTPNELIKMVTTSLDPRLKEYIMHLK
ncbi:MAG: NUDIX domain-containing protein [Candidatus Pacearchaeota archaeon]